MLGNKNKLSRIAAAVSKLKEDKILSYDQADYLERLKLPSKNTSHIVLEKLVDMDVIEPQEPLNISTESFSGEIGSQSPQAITGFIQDLRTNKKGLADMTMKPVKSFISAGIILAVAIGLIMAVIIIPQQLPSIMTGIDKAQHMQSSGGGGISLMPNIFGGHFILGIKNFFM